MAPELGELHWRDGWCFARLADGTVRVRYAGGATPPLEADIPSNEWTSIVRHVGGTVIPGDIPYHDAPDVPVPPTAEEAGTEPSPQAKKRARRTVQKITTILAGECGFLDTLAQACDYRGHSCRV